MSNSDGQGTGTFTDRKCFARHSGLWLCEPREAMTYYDAVVKNGWRSIKAEVQAEGPASDAGVNVTQGGTAIIPITGMMMKGTSKMFDGTSTLKTRRQISAAMADDSVSSILMFIDSPGGHVDGTDELAADIRAADLTKPVFSFIEDMGASAALWVASQSSKVFTNRMAAVGSIGVFAVVTDASEAMEQAGIKVHVISTGDFKGGAFGAEVSEAQIGEVQKMVDAINVEFKGAVKKGRSMTAKAVDAIADGRMFTAPEAQALGLTDGVSTIEKVLGAMDKEVRARGRARRARATAAQLNIDKRK